jgi:hypothetical protein
MYNGTSADETVVADEFRDEILDLTKDTINSRYRAKLVRQRDLWVHGVKLGLMMKESAGVKKIDKQDIEGAAYYGGKWGIYLRAPDIWFQLCNEFSEKIDLLEKLPKLNMELRLEKIPFFYQKIVLMKYLIKMTVLKISKIIMECHVLM